MYALNENLRQEKSGLGKTARGSATKAGRRASQGSHSNTLNNIFYFSCKNIVNLFFNVTGESQLAGRV